MKYDLIISNPPYGSPGNTITKNIIENVDYDCFVNLLPCNDYRRYNKGFKLYQFVDLNTIRPIMKGFKDAAVTTMMCRINKDRAYYISETEFEIENYTDKLLKKYFYETYRRSHYAIDNSLTWIYFDGKETNGKTILLDHRFIPHKHLAYSKNVPEYKWNMEKSIDLKWLETNSNCPSTPGKLNKYVITFDTEAEKDNFADFIYSNDGFRFISKIVTACSADSTITLNKIMPKVDWTKPQTVQSILKDYSYTQSEIDDIIDDLKNYRYMDEAK